jgi:hypothetical protein
MAGPKHSRKSIIQTLQNIAAQEGKTNLSKQEVGANIPLSSINYHFGNLGNALSAAGLVANPSGVPDRFRLSRLSDDDLFSSLLEIERRIGHPPSLSEYRASGGAYSGNTIQPAVRKLATRA